MFDSFGLLLLLKAAATASDPRDSWLGYRGDALLPRASASLSTPHRAWRLSALNSGLGPNLTGSAKTTNDDNRRVEEERRE
ncbi:hypothetical protein PABG_12469 [Paracoccidioides brasiliensis Pb03]|nr:hypothetical protein PABG_12469 [Paracoccidioides brasiliensis Pb03]